MSESPTFRIVVIGCLLLPLSGFCSSLPDSESGAFPVNTAIVRTDSDSDGMIDSWEVANGLNTSSNDAALDPDGDLYSNIAEYNAGSDPQSPDPHTIPFGLSALFVWAGRDLASDTDGDGLPDIWELANGLNTTSNDAALDPDGDGLTNLEEYNANGDPQVDDWTGPFIVASTNTTVDTGAYPLGWTADTDTDGMPDWWEAKYGLNITSNDAAMDLDGDGIGNYNEYMLGMLPNTNDLNGIVTVLSALWTLDELWAPPDTDGDGMPDWWENTNGLNSTSNDAAQNPDGDTLTNIEEYNTGTDPQVNDWLGPYVVESTNFTGDTGGFNGGYSLDTDADGMPDWWEIKYTLNVSSNDASGNPDADALTNLEEYNGGSDPRGFDWLVIEHGKSLMFIVDTGGYYTDNDFDGMPNWWELKHFGNITNASFSADADGDTFANLGEFVAGTDPYLAASYFNILQPSIATNETDVVISWNTIPRRLYSVYSSANLLDSWTNKVYEAPGTGLRMSYTNASLVDGLFLRVYVKTQ